MLLKKMNEIRKLSSQDIQKWITEPQNPIHSTFETPT